MRFMIIVKGNKDTEAAKMPPQEIFDAMADYHEELAKAGVLLDGSGLQPTSKGWRIRYTGDKRTVTDGPFAEAKELVGGYAIIEAGSKQEAIEHGKRFMQLHADVLGREYEGELEVRQLVDFGREKC